MRRQMMMLTIAAATLAIAPACASKGFVRESVGEVNEKVGTLGTSLEQTQERVRQNEQKIGQVGESAAAANTAAATAQTSADAAAGAAKGAQAVGERADVRASAIEAETRKLTFETVISEDRGQFKFGAAELPEEARSAIDLMVSQLTAGTKAVWIEIEGHTDSVGDTKHNERLGLQRAEAVKRYLHEHHEVSLHKMNTLSYGESKPAGDNKTRDGRSQNRRVVIKVLT